MNKLPDCCKQFKEKTKKYGFTIIIVILFIQLLIPILMIYGNEIIAKVGTEIKLEIRQFDPYDYFRGRYLNIQPVAVEVNKENISKSLNMKLINQAIDNSDYNFNNRIKCFVTFKEGKDGMYKVDKVTDEKPKDTKSYLKANLNFYNNLGNPIIEVDYNIKKFFINEKFASIADQTIRELPNEVKSYIKVKIMDGDFVIENLYIGDKNIYEYLK
ncbi:MAG TPA: hypothetical protein DEP72_05710 [Clostridiales bacterium]|nr:MAG: hypothetical protein A2Y18_02800 [Clostridiales bacterium GWD2_32_19]HCC07639.1 hypothetical protein [Clostridiales bacterium]